MLSVSRLRLVQIYLLVICRLYHLVQLRGSSSDRNDYNDLRTDLSYRVRDTTIKGNFIGFGVHHLHSCYRDLSGHRCTFRMVALIVALTFVDSQSSLSDRLV